MNNDKAFRKALSRQQSEPSFGFEERLMKRILYEAESKKIRNDYLGLALISVVSMAMIGGAFWALKHFFSFNLLQIFSGIKFRIEPSPLYANFFGIALLVLLLLGFDLIIRQSIKRRGRLSKELS
jgi:hypothetical protein